MCKSSPFLKIDFKAAAGRSRFLLVVFLSMSLVICCFFGFFFKCCLQQGGAISRGTQGQLKSVGTIYHPVSPFQSQNPDCYEGWEPGEGSAAIPSFHFCLGPSAQSPSDWGLSVPPAAFNTPSCLCLSTLALLAHKHAQRLMPEVCTYPSRDADKQLNR